MKRHLVRLTWFLLLIAGSVNAASAQQISISGTLATTVEAGGWLIVQGSEKYLLLNANRFSKESWFTAGTSVAAVGELRPGAVTIYQEGKPFEATTLTPQQTSSGTLRRTTVTVSGEARVSATPDTAVLTISVVTQNASAIEAQQQNSAQTATVITAARSAAGTGAEIKTSGYVLTPQRVYKENQPPTITGYEARNTITVTMGDLAKVGSLIDAVARAGANNIEGVSFTLRQDRTARSRALADATLAAMAKADALANTLKGKVVRIVAVQEGGVTPRPIYARQEAFARTAADTPIEPGTLDIYSQVDLIAEIEPGTGPN
jgi:uncharacterized protein